MKPDEQPDRLHGQDRPQGLADLVRRAGLIIDGAEAARQRVMDDTEILDRQGRGIAEDPIDEPQPWERRFSRGAGERQAPNSKPCRPLDLDRVGLGEGERHQVNVMVMDGSVPLRAWSAVMR